MMGEKKQWKPCKPYCHSWQDDETTFRLWLAFTSDGTLLGPILRVRGKCFAVRFRRWG